jgi:hypothetical protein
VDLEKDNRWFYRMDSDERSSFRNVGLLVTGFGAVVTLMVSSFSHGLGLMFGLGPAIAGLALVFFSFVPVPKPPPPPQMGILWLLCLGIPSLDLFGYHFPTKVGRYAAVATLISIFLLWFWRPARRPLKPTH